LSAV